jgi:light-regulated signal transduction histidine kinase (bacteriophytochrome)
LQVNFIYLGKMDRDGREQRDFLLRACHDLRAALRAVRVNAQLLAGKSDREEMETILGFMVEGARNADLIVDGLVNYALALRVQISPVPVPTAAVLRTVLANLAPEVNSSGAAITYDGLPEVRADPDRLMQLFENLLRNAIQQRSEAPPRIHVSAQENGGQWQFSISDNGSGLDPRDLERIFLPFERLGRNHGRVGLGLTICREIVAGHGGKIWAESQPGAGTKILFTIDKS